jgi:hypothetical protein
MPSPEAKEEVITAVLGAIGELEKQFIDLRRESEVMRTQHRAERAELTDRRRKLQTAKDGLDDYLEWVREAPEGDNIRLLPQLVSDETVVRPAVTS